MVFEFQFLGRNSSVGLSRCFREIPRWRSIIAMLQKPHHDAFIKRLPSHFGQNRKLVKRIRIHGMTIYYHFQLNLMVKQYVTITVPWILWLRVYIVYKLYKGCDPTHFCIVGLSFKPLKIDPWNLGDSCWKPAFVGDMLFLRSVSYKTKDPYHL